MAIQRGNAPITIYRGDSYRTQYTLTDVDDATGITTPVDISSFEINGQVRFTPDSDQIWFTLPITKTDPINGVFEWVLTETESKALLPPGATTPNTAVYDIQLRIPDANPDNVRVLTFLQGTFSVQTDVTRLS